MRKRFTMYDVRCTNPRREAPLMNHASYFLNPIKVKPGFTLIEMMVAVTIFAIVMMIGVGALLSLVEANRRAQAINSVMNNLNAALESMTRSIRVGTSYHCGSAFNYHEPLDCEETGGTLFAFESAGGSVADLDDQVVYRKNGTQLERSLNSGDTWVALTAPEVTIESFTFFVAGAGSLSKSGDTRQPRVLMQIKGSAAIPGGITEFSVQASVTQRIIDI